MAPTLREPRASDYAVVASWIPDAATCMRWAGPRVPFPFTVAELPRLLALDNGGSRCLAQGDAAPCAFGQYWVFMPGAVHLGRIVVAPVVRGRGIGRLLCEQLIAVALQATRAPSVTLRVRRDNPAAMALYASLGFAPEEAASDPAVLFMRLRVGP